MPNGVNAAIKRVKAGALDRPFNRALRVAQGVQLFNRHDSMLASREPRQIVVTYPPPRGVWLSFSLHKRPKLNHTLFSPPTPLLFVLRPRSVRKKAAGLKAGGF